MLASIANSLLGFIIAIGVLVTVHEFGHFWVARKLGVKVLRFSIGFGKPLKIWRRSNDPTEYVLAAIPLGGYVKMLDEREGEVPEAEKHLAFNRKPLWVRSAVVLAGPMFNLVFAVVLFWAVLVLGEVGLRPIVGEVLPDTPAQRVGLQPGDEILRINGERTPTWEQVFYQLAAASAAGRPIELDVRDTYEKRKHYRLPAEALGDMAEVKKPLEKMGIKPDFPVLPAVIGDVLPNKPAQRAGLQAGDRILAADGQPIESWQGWVEYVQARPLKPIRLEIERDGQRLEIEIVPDAIERQGKTIGQVGIMAKPMPELWARYRVEYALGPLQAIPQAFKETWNFSILTLKVMWRVLTGQASLKNLGGPVTMADAAGSAVSAGLATFLKLLAVISVSLGVFNLLPIPVLDGGHLVYFAIEGIMGRPPSEAFMLKAQQVGMALLLALMILVFYQDIVRLMGP